MAKKSKSKQPPAEPAAPSSNWKALKTAIKPHADSSEPVKPLKRKRRTSSPPVPASPARAASATAKGKEKETTESLIREKGLQSKKEKKLVPVEEIMSGGRGDWQKETGHYLALDCEMVGVGPEGVESTLARVSIVNYHGHTVLDTFVRPRERVTDYRTWVSGVREQDLTHAPSFQEVQKKVADLLKDRILIGHALSNDTNVLLLSHPWHMTRDTSKYSPLQGLTKTNKPSLRTLAKLVLGLDIQAGEHSSVTDARATMAIYRSQKSAWEDSITKHSNPALLTTTTRPLLTIDYSRISLTGVGKKKNLAVAGGFAGVASVYKYVQQNPTTGMNEDRDEAGTEDEGDTAEEVERERRKKRRTERDGDMVLGFDFEKPTTRPVNVQVDQVKPARAGPAGGDKKKRKPMQQQQKGSGGVSLKGDSQKRPTSKAGWWEED